MREAQTSPIASLFFLDASPMYEQTSNISYTMTLLRPLLRPLLYGGLTLATGALTPTIAAPTTDTLTLSSGWTFAETGKTNFLPATVPGVVQQDLIRHGQLPDPYYRLAEDSIQWVGERDWTYRCTFKLSAKELRRPSAHLLFEGLDTYASVLLNGKEILQSKNMFVGHEVDVRHLLKTTNELEIRFRSPLKAALPLYEKSGINYPADNDHAPIHLSVFTRKAPYHYGWDWGERMVTIGPWRPIRLLLRGADYFATRPLITYHPERELPIEVRLPEGAVAGQAGRRLSYELLDAEGKTVFARTAPLSTFYQPTNKGGQHAVPNLRLWWPKGYGTPYRYQARFILRDRLGRALDSLSFPVGFRTTELVREEDKDGRSFYFRINGKPVFAKGANYIPGTMMLPTRTDGQLRQLFDDMEGANFNMVRVWGGGTYENDAFYDEADARGILVWQDFMFACTAYPGDEAFLQDVQDELRYNIRRLRQHPSIATWCGNNEIREGLKYWGWAKKYPKEVYETFWSDYNKLFGKLIPETLQTEDPSRPYIESSPDTVNWGRPHELGLGESHYWGVWYGREPFEILRERIPRFMSEFGVQSFPMLSSIERFARPEDYDLESAVMKGHQKSSIGNDVILHYIRQDYPEPKTFADFVYLSQVMQGQGIALGLRAHRAAAPYCMGTLYWQLNDAWPAVSWSSIDYYGAWKALHYQTKRAFEPIILVPDTAKGKVLIAHDPLPNSVNAVLEVSIYDFSGNLHREISRQPVCLDYGLHVEMLPMPDCVLGLDQKTARRSYIHYRLIEQATGRELASFVDYAAKVEDLDLMPATGYTLRHWKSGEGYTVELNSGILLKDVYIDTGSPDWHVSDNFFDALPGQTYRLQITPRAGLSTKPAELKKLRLRHMGSVLPH